MQKWREPPVPPEPIHIKILLIEDNLGDAHLVRETLAHVLTVSHELTHVDRLSAAHTALNNDTFDVILLDLGLPDGQGTGSVATVLEDAQDTPIVVLTGQYSGGEMAIQMIHEGAQDYLSKGEINGSSLTRSIRYSIERHRLVREMRALATHDDLTGLFNRRGFRMLADHQVGLADRTKTPLSLIFIDMDDLKKINDKLGHIEGNHAIIETADILKATFRGPDIIARIGGDEFVILTHESPEDAAAAPMKRLRASLDSMNAVPGRPYPISFSMGMASYDPMSRCSIDDLIKQADSAMYSQKASRKDGMISLGPVTKALKTHPNDKIE